MGGINKKLTIWIIGFLALFIILISAEDVDANCECTYGHCSSSADCSTGYMFQKKICI